jgi:urea transport system permease protein
MAVVLTVFILAVAGEAGEPPAALVTHIGDVGSADGAVQEEAAVALGKSGDRRVLPLLEALREGSVYVRTLPDGRRETVIAGDKVSDGDKTLVPLFSAYGRDPMTAADGRPLLVDVATLAEVPAGRSLRLALRPLIDGFSGPTQLADADPAVRKAAAIKMGNAGDAAALPALTEALGREGDRWVRHAIEEAVALITLRGGDEAARLAAAARLGELGSASGLERLRDVVSDTAAPAALRHSAQAAVKRIERWALLTSAIETIFQGVSLSSILLLMALGLAIVFGLMGVINMAHGELMALGAYATFVVQGWFAAHWPGSFDYYFVAALPASSSWRARRASRSSAASSGFSTGGRSRRCCSPGA